MQGRIESLRVFWVWFTVSPLGERWEETKGCASELHPCVALLLAMQLACTPTLRLF